jgi:hypothetical protein
VLYPAEVMYQEAAFLGYYFHWSRMEILSLSGLERRRWCREISKMNRELNEDSENVFDPSVVS